MKTLIAGVVASLLLSLPATVHAQKMKLGQVLILHAPDLKPDADTNAFERVVLRRLAPVWKQRAPGIELHLVQKNRGNVKGRYLLAYSIDTLAHAKDYISAASESSPFTGALLAKIGEVRRELPPFTISEGQYVEYRLVGKDNTASLPEVEVLGNHYLKVRPDRIEAFDRFIVEKLNPMVSNLRPDLRLLYYKPVRGTEAGNYLTVFALTRASRDKYWPGGKDSEDLKATFKAPQTLVEELKTYLVEGSYATGNLAAAVYESRTWADWVLVQTEGPVRNNP